MRRSSQAGRTRRRTWAALGVAVFTGACVVRLETAIALLVPALVGVLVLAALVHFLGEHGDDGEARRRLLWWTMAAFVAHLLFGLFVTNAGGRVEAYLRAPDSYAYHNYAIDIVRHWTTGFPLPKIPSGKEGFYYLLAALYWMFGAHTAAGLAVNATLGAALAPVLSDTTRRLFGSVAADYSVKLVVLLPGLFLWTSQLMKEAPILLLIAVTVNLATRLVERLSVVTLVGLATVLALLFTFRAWVALVLAGGLVGGITFGKERVVSGLTTGLSALAFVVLVVSMGVGYSGYQAAVDADLAEAQSVRRDLALSAASGYDAEADISTSTGAIAYLPKGLANFALGPFPWQIRQARQLIVLPEVLAWWVLLPSLVRGVRKGWSWRGRRCLIMILPAGGVACLLALAIGNFGTVVRERMQLVVLLIPFVALGLAQRAARRSEDARQDELIAAA